MCKYTLSIVRHPLLPTIYGVLAQCGDHGEKILATTLSEEEARDAMHAVFAEATDRGLDVVMDDRPAAVYRPEAAMHMV